MDDFAQEAPYRSENAGIPYRNRHSQDAVQRTLPVPHVTMCAGCNGRLNTFLEEPARPVVRKVVPRSLAHAWPTIAADEAAALGKWLLKVCLLWGHPDADDDNPHVMRDPDIGRFTFIEPEWLAWMRDCVDPSNGFTVFISRRDPLSYINPWAGPARRIELPSFVMAGDRKVRFMTRETGIFGLDAAIAWHPAWHVEHPLVTEGRAAVLWPNPAEIDFAALGEVREGEICIVVSDDNSAET
jgi:hypothetical protein